jgi:DNA-binding HxlR family transcriptional regulator
MDTKLDMRAYGGADAYLQKCPSRTVLELLANKWVTLTLTFLTDGPRRFGELRRRLDGITQKSLTQTLRLLERDGLVTRTVYPTVPPRVEYALTPLGESAGELAAHIRLWAEDHADEIVRAREAYTERAQRAPEPLQP